MYVRRRAYLHHGRDGARPCSLAGDLLRHRRREHLAEHLSVGGWVRKQRLKLRLLSYSWRWLVRSNIS